MASHAECAAQPDRACDDKPYCNYLVVNQTEESGARSAISRSFPARGGFEAFDSIHSHVRRFKLQARIFFCSRSSVSSRPPLGRARGTIMRTTVDHALIRGLVTAGPVMRRGASSV